MELRILLPEALGAMAANKLRTALTMLGITIGIAAVICTVAIGEGGSNRVREQFQSLGDNFIGVEAGSRNVQGVRTGTGATKTLTLRDAQAIREAVPLIKSVSPNVDGRAQVVYGNQNWFTQYRGVTPEYLAIRRWTIAKGASFTHQDVTPRRTSACSARRWPACCSEGRTRSAARSALATSRSGSSGSSPPRGRPPPGRTRTTRS